MPIFLICEYSSGMLNSKTRELIALQEEAQARLAETRRAFLDGMKIAKEVKSDLDYVHRKVKCADPYPGRSQLWFANHNVSIESLSKRQSESKTCRMPGPLMTVMLTRLTTDIQSNTTWHVIVYPLLLSSWCVLYYPVSSTFGGCITFFVFVFNHSSCIISNFFCRELWRAMA